MSKRKNKSADAMTFEKFEREYASEIKFQAGVLIQNGTYTEDEYDSAYEEAVDNVASDKGITLL
jgi:hypothetical protein